MQPPPLEEIAKLFPQLEILSLLGRGGMGFVYKARQPRLDRVVALKVLAPDPENRGRFAERFQREAQALARLSHPNIVSVYDFGESGGFYYLVMEFVDGMNLREVIATHKLEPQEALQIVPAICDALQFAHGMGIVHRDIKPENILLDKQGRVKIADFGIAKLLDQQTDQSLTGEAQAIGTPHYMAPEQIERPTEVDHRADIYSLGVVFYEMLTGELPLGKFAPPSKKVQVDVRLDEVVLHALEKEPSRRYQQAREVKTDVETISTSKAGPAPFAPTGAAAPGPIAPASAPATKAAGEKSEKTILPAFLLAFFFGVFGAHRFYVGKTTSAIFQLLTMGGCGIWSTVDWILILCKSFTDKDGRRLTDWVEPDRGPFPAGAAGAGPLASMPADAAASLRKKITAPATGLLIAAGIKIFSAFATGALLVGIAPFLPHLEQMTGLHFLSRHPWHSFFGFVGAAAMLVPSVVVLYGALKMLRVEHYRWAMAAAICSIVFPPFHLIGIPMGIWAVVILSQRDVRAAFGLPAGPAAGAAPPAPGAPGMPAQKIALIAGGVLLLAGIGIAVAVATRDRGVGSERRENFVLSYPLEPGGRLSLANVNGRVEITAAETNAVVIRGVKRGRSASSVSERLTDVDASPDHVIVHTRNPKRWFGWGDVLGVDYKVEVPKGIRLDKIENANGAIEISGVGGDIQASTVNGTITARDVTGNLTASTINGRITAEVTSWRDSQSVSLETVTGRISLTLPADAGAAVTAETVTGKIATDFPSLKVRKKSGAGQSISGSIGSGNGRVQMTTVNGGLAIHKPPAARMETAEKSDAR